MIRKTIALLVLSLLPIAAWTQVTDTLTTDDDNPVNRYPMREFCSTFNVDARIIDSEDNFRMVMDSLQKVQPNAYPLMSQWCRQQRVRINAMIRGIQNDYEWDGEVAWIDSTHCIIDAASYTAQMRQAANMLNEYADHYDHLEQKRLEAERIAAEERARAEAQRIQREKDQRLTELKESIKEKNTKITSICDAYNVSNKAKVKELKDLYYAYLAVYNHYNLTSDNTDDNRFRELEELKAFQTGLIDSVLSDNSYNQRIENFANTLKLRAGKNHTDVNKSYLKTFKRVQIHVTFKNIAEYNEYVGQLRDLIAVQESYLTVIDLREEIARNSNGIQQQCSKKHRDIWNSYKEVLDELNTVPAYTTLTESNKFVATLQEFTQLQKHYSDVIKRIEVIENRGDSIVNLCGKETKDIATAYKSLVDATDFVPKFINLSSANYYNTTLDDFETIQQHYIVAVGLRKQIAQDGDKILASKPTPKGLLDGYKLMRSNTNFVPNFNTPSAGEDFIMLLRHFIKIQDKFKDIIENHANIENTTKQFKIAFKDSKNILKAYNRMIEEYTLEAVILSESDLNSYRTHQDAVIAMQNAFGRLIGSAEKEDVNQRLKKIKEIDKIKLVMGIK